MVGRTFGRKHAQVLGFPASFVRKEIGPPDSGFGGKYENCFFLL